MPVGTLRIGATGLGLLCLAALVLAAPGKGPKHKGFEVGSLDGRFATTGLADDHVSASVGTVVYDGHGGVSREVLVNAPDGSGGRRLLTFDSIGTYEINPDGTGVVYYSNQLSDGEVTETSFDIVIQETDGVGKGGSLRATRLAGVQREPGTTAGLVTTSESLILER